MLDLAGSAPFWRLTVHGGDVDPGYLDRLADLLARGPGAPD